MFMLLINGVLFFKKIIVKQIQKRCILEMNRLLSDSVFRAVSEGREMAVSL